jgi:hypothetical protein
MECEKAVKEIIPAIRSLLADELSKSLTQEQIADALGITQSAVSKYAKQSRGVKAQELMKNKAVRSFILKTAEEIRKGSKVNLCSVCKCVRNVDKCGD